MGTLDQMIEQIKGGSNGGPPRVQVDCTCSKTFYVKMPQLNFMNTPTFSQIIATHERLSQCLNCRAHWMLALGVDPTGRLVWVPQLVPQEVVDSMEESRIVKPTLVPPKL